MSQGTSVPAMADSHDQGSWVEPRQRCFSDDAIVVKAGMAWMEESEYLESATSLRDGTSQSLSSDDTKSFCSWPWQIEKTDKQLGGALKHFF